MFINLLIMNLMVFFCEVYYFFLFVDYVCCCFGEYCVWSVVVLIGEELYSIVMMLVDILGIVFGCWKVFVSDIDIEVLEKVRSGIYCYEELKNLML